MKVNDEKVRTLMFRTRLTQKELAKKTGMSRATISSICNGRSCRLETAMAIADALGVTVDSILMKR